MPVFVDGHGGNHLYVQEIASEDRIAQFEPINIGQHHVHQHEAGIERHAGEPALWAFQFSEGRCVIAERNAIRPALAAVQDQVPPLVRLQMASLYDEKALPEHVAAAHRSIAEIAPRSADLWRDLIVLLPRIRRAMLVAQDHGGAAFHAEVGNINVHTIDDQLYIEASRLLVESVGGEDELRRFLAPLQPLFAALGLVRIEIEKRSEADFERLRASFPTAAGLAIINCTSDGQSIGASRLRNVRYIDRQQLLDERGDVFRERLPRPNEVVLILLEDNPTTIEAAATIGASLASGSSLVGTLVIPGTRQSDHADALKKDFDYSNRFDNISRASRWLAFAGGDITDPTIEAVESERNSHEQHYLSQVIRWVPHAIRACLQVGERGRRAISLLHRVIASDQVVSVTTMTSPGDDAAETATRAALASSKRSACPALTASQLVLVAFHNRPPEAQTRKRIENCARAWNPSAEVMVVEEIREDMTKRVRVVAFAKGQRRIIDKSRAVDRTWIPPPHLLPLTQAGWRVGPRLHRDPTVGITISKGNTRYILRVESELVVDLENVEELERSTPMHEGEVAILVKAVADPRAQHRLLTAGIFCVAVSEPGMLDRYGDSPGAAIRSALAPFDRSEICERVRHYLGDYVLTGLWRLSEYWGFDGAGVYGRWRAGIYEPAPVLEQLQLHRVASDGTWYFRGVIRLESTVDHVPRLRYRFGVALDRQGLRGTRLEPVEGEYDVKAETKVRIEADRERRTTYRHRPDVIIPNAAQQLSLPSLDGSEDRPAKASPTKIITK